jgi:methyl-accepting chemotaxis protein
MSLYQAAHPEVLMLPVDEIGSDTQLRAIAVQLVGETGYTAVYDSDGLVYFHANSDLVGRRMVELAGEFPSFWAIFEASLDGTESAGYYEWQDVDGVVRDKYMSCVPVGNSVLRVAATTYIDEFSRPVQETGAEIAQASQSVRWSLLIVLVVVGMLGLSVALWLAWGISRPVRQLALAATALERGDYKPEILAAEVARRDDLGRLACVFDQVAREVQAREARLQSQIEALFVQVDEVKRARQVAQITDTEYFQELQRQVKKLRSRMRDSRSVNNSGEERSRDDG